MGIFLGREVEGGYETSWIHNLVKPKISGNDINGVGESVERRPTPIYHRVQRHPWLIAQMLFYIRQGWDWAQMGPTIRCGIMKKRQPGFGEKVAAVREEAAPEVWTQRVKEKSLSHPFSDVVGIASLHPDLYFDWEYEEGMSLPKHIIVVAREMDYKKLSSNAKKEEWHKKPFWKRKFKASSETIMGTYEDVFVAAQDLADYIRAKGYPAESLGGPMGSKINMLRAALESGIGELGKHGSLINDEFGSSIRLACVLTDMPLVNDGPRDFGADTFCESCQLCTVNCPPNAISDTKKMVRGVVKWSVDFDKCVPYFNDTAGCATCLTVCPWSRPGVAARLAKKMLKKKELRDAANAA